MVLRLLEDVLACCLCGGRAVFLFVFLLLIIIIIIVIIIIISSSSVKGVLPREVAQAVEVPTTLEATELGRVM